MLPTLETTFYILAIITMSIILLMMIGAVVVLYRIKRKIEDFRKGIPGKVFGLAKEKNMEIASALGITVLGLFLDKVKDAVKKKRE